MTTSRRSAQENRFVSGILPWLIGAVALVIYLLTANHWVSFTNMGPVAESSGWTWIPQFYNPAFYLITYPLRWLPARWLPLSFNLFSAICAAVTVALLARSVALLPHDRTESQRQREKSRGALLSIRLAWIPPVLAAIVCGLQLTFWENATGGSADAFDVLLTAYVIRCLLEFRVSREDSWLLRAALVCGIGMANSWLMFFLLPGLLVSLVWLKRLEILDTRLLFRIFLCVVGGLMLYLLLPSLHMFSGKHLFSFWQGLRMNLSSDKTAVQYLFTESTFQIRMLLVLMGVLPLLMMSIRWASNFGDPSRMGSTLTSWIFHLAHGALLILCVWEFFNPVFSLGYLNQANPALRYFSALTPAAYFVAALCVGYFCGYFLLVFTPIPDRMGRTSAPLRWLHQFSVGVILILLLLVPAGLLYRNLPQLRFTNGPMMKRYSVELIQHLPAQGAILSEDVQKLYLAEAGLALVGKAGNYFFLDTHSLPSPPYHGFLQKRYPGRWPAFVNPNSTNMVPDPRVLGMVVELSKHTPVSYLHPSFGYYFEYFYTAPRGLTLDLIPCTTNYLSAPPLTDDEVAENEKFWGINKNSREQLATFIARPPSEAKESFAERMMNRLHIPFRPNDTAVILGSFYSRSLDDWAVRLQRDGRLKEARPHLQSAIALNVDNVAAVNNLAINQVLDSGQRPTIKALRATEDELGKYRGWQQALNITGPFDDPTHCLGLALAFAQSHNFRQAAKEFDRVHALIPDNPTAQVWLAGLYTRFHLPEKALDLIPQIRAHPEAIAEVGISKLDILQAEAGAYLGAGKTAEAEKLLNDTVEQDPGNTNLLGAVIQISAAFGRYTNAILAVDRLLALQPNNQTALLSKGLFAIQLGRFQDAILPLTHAIDLQTNNYRAQLYRALAYVSSDQLPEAERDYLALQKVFPNSVEVNSGIGDVAWRKKDTNTAIMYYERCLSNAPAGGPQSNAITERLKSLRGESN
jgi:tetratricopeptide (TPR) repeat protein